MKHFLPVIDARKTAIATAIAVVVFSLTGWVVQGTAQDVPVEYDRADAPETVEASRHDDRREWKVLHVMSYHLPWEWTDDQLNGFQSELKDLNVNFRIFQMDTKRRSSEAWKREAGEQARDLIDAWKPDLVYTNDDNAQEYVARHYVDRDIPFVFSGVNGEPADYGFTKARNIAGALEQEHFVETVRFLQTIVSDAARIAVIVDEDPTWNGVVKRMREKAASHLPDVEFASWDVIRTFREYKRKVEKYQTEVDALALLGIHAFKDDDGKNVPWQEVLKWTALNSRLPDFSFWKDRIQYGTLCAVYVSGYEQGRAAGRIARGILAEGKSPSSYPMAPTVKGEPVLSLARARQLGIMPNAELLLTVKVVEKFHWEE